MDSWNDRQIQMMRAGGNDKCISFLAQYNVPKNMAIAMKYNTPGINFIIYIIHIDIIIINNSCFVV
jgi:hypothetical protein